MCRPYRPEDRGNIAIPRPNDLGYYVTALQALLGGSKIYIEHPTCKDKMFIIFSVIVIDFVIVLMRPSTSKQALTGRYIIAQVVRPGYDMTSPSPACKVGT